MVMVMVIMMVIIESPRANVRQKRTSNEVLFNMPLGRVVRKFWKALFVARFIKRMHGKLKGFITESHSISATSTGETWLVNALNRTR